MDLVRELRRADAAKLTGVVGAGLRVGGLPAFNPDVPAKAAALMHPLVMNRPFVDGNKRVGAHAAVVFLRANRFQTGFAPEELTEVTMGLARGEVSVEALAIWIRQRTSERTG